MLDKHFQVDCRPIARPENILFFKKYRVTVLTNRLFRIEKSEDGAFNDAATQAVWFRDTPPVPFSVRESGNAVEIATDAVTLTLHADFEKSRASFGGKRVKLNNAGNLLGTYSTLDGYDGDRNIHTGEKIKLGYGVCARSGVAVLDDGDTLLMGENGNFIPRRPAFDKYIFAFGHDYRAAVQALYCIEGRPPMIPRFALGNWWSRYYAYTDKSYLQLLDRMAEHDIPLTVATVDMDWHYSDKVDAEKQITKLGRNTKFYGGNNGWTGYSWNKNLFPDYRAFLKQVREKNLEVTLNLHPADGVRWWEDAYEAFAKEVGADASTLAHIPFSLASDDYVNAYFKLLHKPYEADGVSFWWIDWQQGAKSDVEGLTPLWALNHFHYLDHAQNHDTPLILSRYCGAGAHRYPLGFSGDTVISWASLNYLPYFTLTASNAGYTWWSHDIGGHFGGCQDEELYARYIQFGVFNPINRLHSTKNETVTKEPAFYRSGAGAIAENMLRFRHKLIPFLYSAAYRTHEEGLALIEPLYYAYPDCKEAYAFKNEYFFGGQLLVAPITKKSGADGYAGVKAWLPEGRWTDIFTGETYTGGCVKTLYRKLDSIPVLAKEGGILPLAEKVDGNGCALPETLRIKVFCGNGSFTLYEKNEAAKDACVVFTARKGEDGVQLLHFTLEGDGTVSPANRAFKIEFADAPHGKIEVLENGMPCAFTEHVADHPTVILDTPKFGHAYTVRLCYTPKTRLSELIENAARVLMSASGDNALKEEAYKKLQACPDESAFKQCAENSPLPRITIAKLLEIF